MIGTGRLLSKGLLPGPVSSYSVSAGLEEEKLLGGRGGGGGGGGQGVGSNPGGGSPPASPRSSSSVRSADVVPRRHRLRDSTHDEIPSIQSQHRPQLPT